MGRPSLATLLVLFLGIPTTAAAQEVLGTLRAEGRGAPIAGARLYLAAVSGPTVDSAFSGPDGAFRLAAPSAGEYDVHFHMDGFAEVTSRTLRLAQGEATRFDFVVTLLSTAAMARIGEMVRSDPRLQESLPEICGEELRLSCWISLLDTPLTSLDLTRPSRQRTA